MDAPAPEARQRTRRASARPSRQPGAGRSAAPPKPAGYSLTAAVASWIREGEATTWGPSTKHSRSNNLRRILWWVEHEAKLPLELPSLTTDAIRDFLAYLRTPCTKPRFGSEANRAAISKLNPGGVATYYRDLKSFLNFCEREGLLTGENPIRKVTAPKVPKVPIDPFTDDHLVRMIAAGRQLRGGDRNAALMVLLLDTGLRISEACGLTVGDLDRADGTLSVVGKGEKRRTVSVGTSARRLLWRYLESEERRGAQPDEPLFTSEGGHTSGAALTPDGAHSMVREAGKLAGIKEVRCSPHTFRHTFAISFLRNGGDSLELQALLGHETLEMVRRYVKFAEQDLVKAHRRASPADRLKIR